MAEEESGGTRVGSETSDESEESNAHRKWLTKYDRPMPEVSEIL